MGKYWEKAGISYRYMSIYEMAYMCAARLLAADGKGRPRLKIHKVKFCPLPQQ